ncbi:MAG: phosphoglycerate kinase [Deltaproteobacteria bacterium]|nr:phosphoglycerate kinase [Deltaproteobacteria bacterium]
MEPGTILKSQGILSVRDLHLPNKRVLLRADFNVPLDESLSITDDSRIRATLPTIEFIRKADARLILCSHLGRPKGKKAPKYSLEPVGRRLAELLQCEVLVPDDCVGDAAIHLIANQRSNQVILLENLRYHAGEEENSEELARKLADLCDVFVCDAFGCVHRAHASVSALPRLVPARGAGLLLEREIEVLTRLTTAPEGPYVALLGGAKVSDKIEVIESLLPLVNGLVIGGAMAYTFLAAQGLDMGKSLVERDHVGLAKHLLGRCAEKNLPVFLPVDHTVVTEIKADAVAVTKANGALGADDIAVDIGPQTIALFTDVLGGRSSQLAGAPRTVLWNGPMGIFEMDAFAAGTMAVARAVAQSTATSVVGGGDSVAAVQKAGVTPMISHISTGGGASLEFLSGQPMPGIAALRGGRR